MSNKLTDLAIETLLIEKDIPFRIDYSKEDPLYRFNIDDFDIYIFSQTWGSTALGFDGLGGQVITKANTCVLVPESCHQDCFVYFAGRFAYSVPYSDEFGEDVRNHSMKSVRNSRIYLRKTKEIKNE